MISFTTFGFFKFKQKMKKGRALLSCIKSSSDSGGSKQSTLTSQAPFSMTFFHSSEISNELILFAENIKIE